MFSVVSKLHSSDTTGAGNVRNHFFFSQKRSISKIKERRICCILLLRLPAFVLNGFYNNWKTVFLFFVFIWWPLCGKNVLFEKLVIFPGTFSLKLYGRLWT